MEPRFAAESAGWTGYAILLVDLDAFFASVEQLDHPEWRGKPVIVGGDADKGGVVATCSYEARRFGVRSAMPAKLASELCPDAIWAHGRHGRYKEVSDQVMDILEDETPYVQQVSIDEAFMDITPTRVNREDPVEIAKRIQRRISGLGITCSIGLGTSKSIAKVASDMDKPKGLTVVYPGTELAFLSPLPVRIMSGIGPRAEKKLHELGILTLGQLASADVPILEEVFGKNARMMRDRSLGLNDSLVRRDDSVKSVSKEITFSEPLSDIDDMSAAIHTLASGVGRRMRKRGIKGHTLTLKLRYADMETHTSQTHLDAATNDEMAFARIACELLREIYAPEKRVRLIGVGMSGFDEDGRSQMSLFDDAGSGRDPSRASRDGMPQEAEEMEGIPRAIRDGKSIDLLNATDKLKDKFGEDAVIFGSQLKNMDNTTNSSSKNVAR